MRRATRVAAVSWAWTLLAGGGGAFLLVTLGPARLTNGWFALASGVAACPLTPRLLERYSYPHYTGRARMCTALGLYVAGRCALLAGL